MRHPILVPAALLALAHGAAAPPAPPLAAPIRFAITSSDSTRPLTARISLTGTAVFVGALRPGGRVELTGASGTITTPAVLELRDGPVTIELHASYVAADVDLEVRPATGGIERIVVPGGGSLRLSRADGATELQFIGGDGLRTYVRPAGHR